MTIRILFVLSLAGAALFFPFMAIQACCPAPHFGQAVVNADQTVILIWDPATKTEHFIRQASFKSEADDFGFLVPSPTQPELSESGNEAFPLLHKLTEPTMRQAPHFDQLFSFGCCSSSYFPAMEGVRVLEEKMVAGFKAQVLEASSATALVGWLKDNGYAFSPEVEAWAKPYVEAGWKITALKVAKEKDAKGEKNVAAAALRMTFHTDRPLFPYREPDTNKSAQALGARNRLLRIYFLAEARYRGELTKETAWTGEVAWSGKLKAADRQKILDLLKLPAATGPAEWWLTEFEDNWPYKAAPADLYFSRDPKQKTVKRPTIYASAPASADVTLYALAGVLVLPRIWRRLRRGRAALILPSLAQGNSPRSGA